MREQKTFAKYGVVSVHYCSFAEEASKAVPICINLIFNDRKSPGGRISSNGIERVTDKSRLASLWWHVLTQCGLVTPYGNKQLGQHGLTGWLYAWQHKPLPEPMLTNHQWVLVEFNWGQFHRKCPIYPSSIWVWKLLVLTYSHIS